MIYIGMLFCSTLLVDSTIYSATVQVDSGLLDSGSEQSKMILVDLSFDSSQLDNTKFIFLKDIGTTYSTKIFV